MSSIATKTIETSPLEGRACGRLSKEVLFALVRDLCVQEVGEDLWLQLAHERLRTLAANELIPRRYGKALDGLLLGGLNDVKDGEA